MATFPCIIDNISDDVVAENKSHSVGTVSTFEEAVSKTLDAGVWIVNGYATTTTNSTSNRIIISINSDGANYAMSMSSLSAGGYASTTTVIKLTQSTKVSVRSNVDVSTTVNANMRCYKLK